MDKERKKMDLSVKYYGKEEIGQIFVGTLTLCQICQRV